MDVIIKSTAVNLANFGAFGVFVNTAFFAVDAILDLYDWYLHQNWTNLVSAVNDES